MNILIITHQGDIAGSTNSISYLAKGLAERGHRVVLGCRKEALLNELVAGSKVIVEHMTFKGKLDRENMRQIRDVVKKYDIQLINAQSGKDRYTSILANKIHKLNAKVVFTRRQVSKSMGGPVSWFYQWGTEKIVAVSEGVKQSLKANGISEHHIEVIYNGTPPEKYKQIDEGYVEELKAKYAIQPSDIVIGCVSRLKKQLQLIKALQLIEFPVTMIFIGIENSPVFQEIIKQYKQPHQIYFEGFVPGDQVLAYFRTFTMSILPSTMEGLSQSLLEAMAMGVPVIATNAAGNPDLVKDQVNGLLFEDEDIEGLARKITLLAENPTLRTQLIDAGKKTALQDFAIERTISNYEAFFQALIDGKIR
ncbi:MAG: glycosyltransferase family 4 protein [Flammeovirgaceae bacterium]